jgi:hypothetical protein
MANQINQISQEDVGLIYRSLLQKYESFLRACFVLPAYKSSILNNEYLDKVSIPSTRTFCLNRSATGNSGCR